MEKITINELFVDEIVKFNSNLTVPAFQDSKRRIAQTTLYKIIDVLGEKSARSQNLNKIITTTNSISNSPETILYILKDPEGNRGEGSVIGMLKMGKKHLYLADNNGVTHQVDPHCVLDFYVEDQVQRKGYGKKLFEYMLADLNLHPHILAIDGPSTKMESFLKRVYNIKLHKQANNFAIAPQFFDHIKKIKSESSAENAVSNRPMGSGRFTARRQESTISSIISGDSVSEPSFNRYNMGAARAGPSTLIKNHMQDKPGHAMECAGRATVSANLKMGHPSGLKVEPDANSAANSEDAKRQAFDDAAGIKCTRRQYTRTHSNFDLY